MSTWDITGASGPMVIAEIGANHNGDMGLAREMIQTAHDCGADAVKFQSWSEDTLLCREGYQRNPFYDAENKHRHFGSLRDMVRRYQFTPEQHREIARYCAEVGIVFLSSAFSYSEIDLLEDLEVPAHKIASMDVNNLPLLGAFAQTGKPILMSTGMATYGEVDRAVQLLQRNLSGIIVPLHCVAVYPCPPLDCNLRNIATLRSMFGDPVGYSDHTDGIAAAIASVAFGAAVIEKHFTLDRNMEGWDHWFAADPPTLKALCAGVKDAYHALGSTERTFSRAEREKAVNFRRSIVATRDIPAGTRLTMDMLTAKRPAIGIGPDRYAEIVGRTAKRAIQADDLIRMEDLA